MLEAVYPIFKLFGNKWWPPNLFLQPKLIFLRKIAKTYHLLTSRQTVDQVFLFVCMFVFLYAMLQTSHWLYLLPQIKFVELQWTIGGEKFSQLVCSMIVWLAFLSLKAPVNLRGFCSCELLICQVICKASSVTKHNFSSVNLRIHIR